MKMRFSLFLVLIISSLRGYKSECTSTEEELDGCMLDVMFFGSEKTIVPANDNDMNGHCTQVKKGIECMKQYSSNCIKGFPQQVTTMIFNNMGDHIDKRCDQPKERAEFIENAKCFLPKEKMKPVDICSDKHTSYMEIASKMTKDDQMSGTCCGYFLFKHCIVSEVNKLCGDGHAQYWDEILDEVASEAVTFACADFNSKDQCSKLLKSDQWQQLNKIDEATDPAVWSHHYKTPIKFMLEMVKTD